MAVLITYIFSQFGITLPLLVQVIIAWVFSAIVGFIAMRGINGSTMVSIVINIIQLTALIVFSILASHFRVQNPLGIAPGGWFHPAPTSIVIPHNLAGLLFQSTIAILILVGFESSTALGAEAINPKRDIPCGVILSLVIQGLFAYLLEYFAANSALSDKFTSADGTLTGISAAAASNAPIGDLAIQIGNAFLGGNGFAFMLVIAFTVAIAILGTTLAAMNTGVRISFAMAQDSEMPGLMGLLHEKYATPYIGVVIMVIVSAVIGTIGVLGGVTALTGITLASNLGTFVLYALICAITFVAFAGSHEYHAGRHALIPFLGLVANIIMVLAIFIIGLISGGSTTQATFIALGISAGWLVVSTAYLLITSSRQGKLILPSLSKL
ncbi:MAG: amino acid permease [Anaerolineaceae bacterium]|nr:amino acid permease [Anaerolineaceae bacterium]